MPGQDHSFSLPCSPTFGQGRRPQWQISLRLPSWLIVWGVQWPRRRFRRLTWPKWGGRAATPLHLIAKKHHKYRNLSISFQILDNRNRKSITFIKENKKTTKKTLTTGAPPRQHQSKWRLHFINYRIWCLPQFPVSITIQVPPLWTHALAFKKHQTRTFWIYLKNTQKHSQSISQETA